MRKRFLAILLASVLVVMLLPVMAFATEEIPAAHGLKVKKLDTDGTTVIDAVETNDYSWDGNKLIIPKSGLIVTGTTATENILVAPDVTELTLSGMKIIPTAEIEEGILINENPLGPDSGCICTITLIGENQIGNAVTYNEETTKRNDYFVNKGILADGNIIFTGTGNLTIYDKEQGILTENGNVTFDESFSGKLTIEDFGYENCAINSSGDVMLLGGIFDLISHKSNGINADGNVTINGLKKLEIHAGGEGIWADGNVTITSCKDVDIFTAGESCDEAIDATGTVSIIGCKDVTLVSYDDDDTIYAGDIVITNSTVDVTSCFEDGLDADSDENGMGKLTINGGSKVTIHAEDNAIECNSLIIEGIGTVVYAVGDTDEDKDGAGALILGGESAITVTGGTVKFTSDVAAIILRNYETENNNPFTGNLPNVSFTGNKAFDTFESMQDVKYKSNFIKEDEGKYVFEEYAYVGDSFAKSVMIESPEEEKPDKTKNTVVIEINGSSLPMTPEKEENPNTGAMDLKPMAVMGTIIALSALAFAGKKH